MVAVVRSLLVNAIDDAVDVFTVLMAVKLIRPAERASDRQRLRVWDELAGASATLASTGRVLLELIADTDDPDDPLDPAIAWGRLVSTVRADRLAHAIEIAGEVAPSTTDRDRRAGARAELVTKYATVAQFLGVFADTIQFAAIDAGAGVLAALRQLASVVSGDRLGQSR